MKAKGAIAEMIDTGLFTLASNSWLEGKLASYAREHNFRVKSPTVVRRTPPWSRARRYLDAMSPAQLWVIKELHNTLIERLGDNKLNKLPASVAVKEKMKGKKAPAGYSWRTVKAPLTAEKLRAIVSDLESDISEKLEKGRVVIVAPPAGRERALGG